MSGGSPSVLVLASLFTNSAAPGAYVSVSETGQPIDIPQEATQIVRFDDPMNDNDVLPRHLADELVSRLNDVTPRDVAYLREWMTERRLKAALFSSAIQYLAQMNRENLAFAAASRTHLKKDRVLTLYSGEGNLFWLGNNDPAVEVYLTRGDETREIRHGRPQRLQAGDIFTYRDTSGRFVIANGKGMFYPTDIPSHLRDDPEGEATQVVRRPVKK